MFPLSYVFRARSLACWLSLFSDVILIKKRDTESAESAKPEKGTSRQRSGKRSNQKKIPTPKTEAEKKNKPKIRYLYHENISKAE